ncbi:MAG: substrate-binding domain-containing protein [Alphaproteobacteria bacterium]
MKNFLKLTTVVTIATALSASAADKPIKIGALVYGLNAEFMQLWAQQAEKHPAVASGQVELTVLDGRYDALVQNNQFETLVTRQFDAAVFVPIDIDAGATGVETAHNANIPVVGSNTRVNSDLLASYVGSDDVQSGYMEAKAVLDKIGCKGNVVIIEGPLGQSAQVERLKGNQKALAECPDVKVLEQKTANWSRAEALSLMENWLTAHKGQIDGVIGQNDEMALGAIEAIKSAGLKVEDFAIAGIDGISDALRAVKAGEMVSILQDGGAQAQGAIDVALRQVLGADYEPQSEIWKKYPDMPWNGGNDKVYNVPWTPVTLDNVDELLKSRQ